MAPGKFHEGNKTNRMVRLGETEVGTFRQLRSVKSPLRKWYLRRDLKYENEPCTQQAERGTPGRESFEEQKESQCGWRTWSEWRGDQEIKKKSCVEGPMVREGLGYSSLEQVLNISHWLLNKIIEVHLSYILGLVWTVSQSSAIGSFPFSRSKRPASIAKAHKSL